jgi:hypothetical protein
MVLSEPIKPRVIAPKDDKKDEKPAAKPAASA